MVFDGTLANTKLPGDDFTGLAGQNPLQDLVLSTRQCRDTECRGLPRREKCVHYRPRLFRYFIVAMAQDPNFRAELSKLRFLSYRHAEVARLSRAVRMLKDYDI